MRQQTRNEIRCFCRREPLLATYGLDDKNKIYIHVKVYKNRRIYGEILVTKGEIQLRCRECMRWYRISIADGEPRLIETPVPDSVIEEAVPGHG